MALRVTVLAVVLLALMPVTASASLAGEQQQGRTLLQQLQSGAKSCDDLSDEDLDHIGEYVMWRAVGSTRTHEALNARMTAMMGDQAERGMHEAMGARAAGCSTSAAAGPGMMMGASGSSWMMGGAWRHMSQQDWQQLHRQWLGSGGMMHHGGGWGTWAVVAAVLVALLVGAAVMLAVMRGRASPPPPAAA